MKPLQKQCVPNFLFGMKIHKDSQLTDKHLRAIRNLMAHVELTHYDDTGKPLIRLDIDLDNEAIAKNIFEELTS